MRYKLRLFKWVVCDTFRFLFITTPGDVKWCQAFTEIEDDMKRLRKIRG